MIAAPVNNVEETKQIMGMWLPSTLIRCPVENGEKGGRKQQMMVRGKDRDGATLKLLPLGPCTESQSSS